MKAKPLRFIASRHVNQISHRKVTRFEEASPSMFGAFHSVHDTWEGAHEWLIAIRRKKVEEAKKELARAEKSLAGAMKMKNPEERK